MSNKRLRSLAPAISATGSSPSDGSSGPSFRPAVDLPRRTRAPGRSACQTCRTRKTACDGVRPVCGACKRMGKSHCEYMPRQRPADTLQELRTTKQENEALREAEAFLGLLASAPEDEAGSLLRQFRAGGDISALLAGRAGSALRRGSSQADDESRPVTTKQKSQVPRQSSLEFELMTRHPIAYPTLVPVDAAYLDLTRLLNPEDVSWVDEELTSLLDRNLADDIFDAASTLSEDEQAIHDRLSRRPSHSPGADTPPLAGPFTALCDDRLAQIDVGRWTNVNITNEFAIRVISLYLTVDHPVLGLFDASLFIDNAVSGEEHFCSKLLFSALLASACQSYSYLESEAASLSKLFYQEASRHWESTLQDGHFTLTSVAASQLLSITALCDGKDAESIDFLKTGTRIGKQLGLFGVSEDGSAKSWLGHHDDWVRAASHTAWGVFGWVTSRCVAFHAGQIECPPVLPIPGDGRRSMGIDLSVDPAVDTDPIHQHEEFHPLPEYMGRTFPALCKLWTIANEFLWSHYDHDDTIAPMTRAILERAHATYRQLLEWADNLPLDMARSDDNRHHTVITHVFYHAIVLDVFRPFMMMKGTERDTRLHSFTSADASPASIYAASEKQLLRLTLLYRARYQQNLISFLWQTALLYVANVKLGLTSNLAKPSSTTGTAERQGETSAGGKIANRRWLRVCLKGYETLYQSFPAVEKTVLALLSMALRDRIFTADEARDVMSQMRKSVESKPPRSGGGKEVEQDSDAGNQTEVMTDEEAASRPGTPARTQDLKSTWPTPMADLDLAMFDPLASHVQTLAAQFHELALFEEFTIGEEEESPEDESGERMSLDN